MCIRLMVIICVSLDPHTPYSVYSGVCVPILVLCSCFIKQIPEEVSFPAPHIITFTSWLFPLLYKG